MKVRARLVVGSNAAQPMPLLLSVDPDNKPVSRMLLAGSAISLLTVVALGSLGLTAAGIVSASREPAAVAESRLEILENTWRAASPEERAEFNVWLKQEGWRFPCQRAMPSID